MMFHKIMFPTDLMEDMYRIFPFVTDVADRFGAEIHCVYSLQVSNYYAITGSGAAHMAESEVRVISEAKDALSNFVSENLGGRNIRISVMTGKPGNRIVDYARENNIDLIIMGHSTTGIDRNALGSVAAHVVKYSLVPVMIISPELLQKCSDLYFKWKTRK
jgi:nucleotide-binding universal stress UspA family protein